MHFLLFLSDLQHEYDLVQVPLVTVPDAIFSMGYGKFSIVGEAFLLAGMVYMGK